MTDTTITNIPKKVSVRTFKKGDHFYNEDSEDVYMVVEHDDLYALINVETGSTMSGWYDYNITLESLNWAEVIPLKSVAMSIEFYEGVK